MEPMVPDPEKSMLSTVQAKDMEDLSSTMSFDVLASSTVRSSAHASIIIQVFIDMPSMASSFARGRIN